MYSRRGCRTCKLAAILDCNKQNAVNFYHHHLRVSFAAGLTRHTHTAADAERCVVGVLHTHRTTAFFGGCVSQSPAVFALVNWGEAIELLLLVFYRLTLVRQQHRQASDRDTHDGFGFHLTPRLTCRAYREANLGRGLPSLLRHVRSPRADRRKRSGEDCRALRAADNDRSAGLCPHGICTLLWFA